VAEGITAKRMRRSADALRFTECAGIDCVLLDLSLPDGTGHQLLSQWRRSAILVPIIIITAHSALAERLAGFDAGRRRLPQVW